MFNQIWDSIKQAVGILPGMIPKWCDTTVIVETNTYSSYRVRFPDGRLKEVQEHLHKQITNRRYMVEVIANVDREFDYIELTIYEKVV